MRPCRTSRVLISLWVIACVVSRQSLLRPIVEVFIASQQKVLTDTIYNRVFLSLVQDYNCAFESDVDSSE